MALKKNLVRSVRTIDPRIQAIINRINKDHGTNTLVLASQAVGLNYIRSSCGSFGLDMGIGGGLCFGRIHLFIGKESSTKTALALISVANIQMKYSDEYVMYVDAERTFDRKKAQELGVDLERLIILNPDSLEQGGDVVQELLEEGVLKGLVIDSWAALVPTAEYEDSLDKGSMGRNALCKNKFVRKMVSATKKDLLSANPSCLIIIINHINMNVGVTWGSPEVDTGGMGKNYFTSIRVKLTRIETLFEGTEDNKRAVGIRVKWAVTKNKTDVPYKEGTYDYYFTLTKYVRKMGIDRVGEIIEYAKKWKLIPDGMQRRTFEAFYLGKSSYQKLQENIRRKENVGKNQASAEDGAKQSEPEHQGRKKGRPKAE